jgi:hypothetical protein
LPHSSPGSAPLDEDAPLVTVDELEAPVVIGKVSAPDELPGPPLSESLSPGVLSLVSPSLSVAAPVVTAGLSPVQPTTSAAASAAVITPVLALYARVFMSSLPGWLVSLAQFSKQ